MGRTTSEEEFDKAMTEHATPIVEQTFTKEDIKALREYLDKLEELSKVPPPVKLTPEEWDEALTAIEQTGEIPAKYAGRIGKRELTGAMLPPAQAKRRKEGEKFFAYYDIAFEEYHAQFYTVREEYRQEIEKVIIANLAGQTTTKKTGGDIADLIKSILDNPEIMRELEKEARRLELDRLPSVSPQPNGEIIHFLLRIINSGRRNVSIEMLNRNVDISTVDHKGIATYTRTNKTNKNTSIIEIRQADNILKKSGGTFSKVFLFTLQKMASQGFPLEVAYNLQEMVDLGMYSNTSNAGRAVRDFFEQQKLTTLKGTIKKGKKTIKEEGGILFYHYHLENGIAVLTANDKFNMEFLAPYYTIFPRFAYALSENAFSLISYIFFLARQSSNTKKIKETGTFSIGLDAVRDYLGLLAPEDVKNRKHREKIINPIEAAIEEIEEAAKKEPEAQEYGFTITPRGTETTKIYEWLQGSLEIGLKKEFAERFIQIASEKDKKIKNMERAKLEAVARLEAKKENEK